MKPEMPNRKKRTGVRPTYIELGEDTKGAWHLFRTVDETIHVVQDGARIQRFDLDGTSADEYVQFVRDDVDDRDWATRKFLAADEDPFTDIADTLCPEVTA